jgi:hypothetical protein
MRNLWLIASFMLVSVCVIIAQPSQPGSAQTDPKPTTVQGCLKGADGSFVLTSDSGTTYELVGDSHQLSRLAGMEVSVTGNHGSASDISTGESGHTGLATSNPTAGTAPTIQVMHAKKISSNCTK